MRTETLPMEGNGGPLEGKGTENICKQVSCVQNL